MIASAASRSVSGRKKACAASRLDLERHRSPAWL
jgi:hypothetical protein